MFDFGPVGNFVLAGVLVAAFLFVVVGRKKGFKKLVDKIKKLV